MDDAGWLIGAMFVIIGIILAVMAMAAIAIIGAVAACGYGLYRLGKYFVTQVRTKYKLTSTSIMVLVVIGLITAAILGVTCASLSSTVEQVVLGILSPAILLGILVLTVAIWGRAKRSNRVAPVECNLTLLRKQISDYDWQVGVKQREVNQLQAQIRDIRTKHGCKMEEAQRLEESIKEICLEDPRLWVLKRQEWEVELGKLPEGKLSFWQDCSDDSPSASKLKSSLVAREKLNRATSSAASRLPKLETRLSQFTEEIQRFASEKKRLSVELQMREKEKEAMKEERIVLD